MLSTGPHLLGNELIRKVPVVETPPLSWDDVVIKYTPQCGAHMGKDHWNEDVA